MLKRNLIANYIGQGWSGLMSIIFIPVYVSYTGIESYGLIGVFALLQAWLVLLDLGMAPTISREMARFSGGGYSSDSIRDLLRSIEALAFSIAILMGITMLLFSGWIATSWLQVEELPIARVSRAFCLMGLVASLRLIEGIYRSALIGLQHQVTYNVFLVVISTLRGGGAVVVLALISPSIIVFFEWQVILSVISLVILSWLTYRRIPKGERTGRFSLNSLREVKKFAGGVMGITFLALLLTQVDRVLISRLLTLSEFGYYTVAATVASGINMLIAPITQAWNPKLCEVNASGDEVRFTDLYHKGAQLVSVIGGAAAVVLIVFSSVILEVWTRDPELAMKTATLVSILTLGNLLNCLVWIPNQAQLAKGITDLGVKINAVSVMVIVPAILWAVPRFGAEGAAWVWVALNVGYILVGIHLMHKRILKDEKKLWYIRDVAAPIALAAMAVFSVSLFLGQPTTHLMQIGVVGAAAILAVVCAVLGAGRIRVELIRMMKTCRTR